MANKKQKMVNKQKKQTTKRKIVNPTKITLNCYFQIKIKTRFLLKIQFDCNKNHKLELDHRSNSSLKPSRTKGRFPP
jgi:hypothetical protein